MAKRNDHPITVLIVEDNRADTMLIRSALQDLPLDLDVQDVDDGEKAIEFIDAVDRNEGAACPDVVLLDLNIPRHDGLDVLRRIHKSEKWQHAKVVILSSSESPRDRAESARLGANRYFCKPTDLDEFLAIAQIVMELVREGGE